MLPEIENTIRSTAQQYLVPFCLLTDKNYEINWHHKIIAEELENTLEKVIKGDKARIILQLPPRHGKSELATIKFPAWVLGKFPDLPIIIASYSSELAEDFGQKTRDLVLTSQYQTIFNTRLRADTQSKGKWLTQQNGGYTATGVGGSITGRGFKIGILDDPIKNREEAESLTYRNKTWDWFISTFYTRQDGNGAIIIILTRWHQDDLVGRLLRKQRDDEQAGLIDYDKWQVINFPAIATEDETNRKLNEPLWEQRFNLEKLNTIKNTIGLYEWNALYQQMPISAETQEFRHQWFNYRTHQDIKQLDTRNYLTIDTAVSQRSTADYTGIVSNFVDNQNKWNISAYRQRLTPTQLIDTIFTLYALHRYEKIGIEKTIYLMALKPFIEDEMRKRNIFLPIQELEHRQINKHIRIRGLIPRYESGSIFHIKGETIHLEDELLSFPQGLHDDILDSLAYQLQIAERPDEQNTSTNYIHIPTSEYEGAYYQDDIITSEYEGKELTPHKSIINIPKEELAMW